MKPDVEYKRVEVDPGATNYSVQSDVQTGASLAPLIPYRDRNTAAGQSALAMFATLKWNLVEQDNYTVLVMHSRHEAECKIVVGVAKRNPNYNRRWDRAIALQVAAVRAFRSIVSSVVKEVEKQMSKEKS